MLERLKAGVRRTREGLAEGIGRLLQGGGRLDAAGREGLEDLLLGADVGVAATAEICDRLVARLQDSSGPGPAARDPFHAALAAEMTALLAPRERLLTVRDTGGRPFVCLMVGVNGAGKTTTIGKLAHRFQIQGYRCLLAAGDTFRAAAVEQLAAWGARNEVPVIAQGAGADPASVLYDAMAAAEARGIDVVLADTAGRLHTQGDLMNELKKVRRVIQKQNPEAPHETLLVLDATNGQNAIRQAREFHREMGVTGLVLTKLDGTAKGGVVFALAKELALPICFIGIGEGMDDLREFSAADFVAALLHQGEG